MNLGWGWLRPASGKLTSMPLDTFTLWGVYVPIMMFQSWLYPDTCWAEEPSGLVLLVFSLFLELRVIVFCFLCKYLWAAIIFKCIYQKWIIGRSCKTKQKKKNNLKFLVETNCIDFWSWPVIGVLNKGVDVLVREHRWGNRNYTICVKERKTAMWNNPIGFQLCYCLYIFERLITLLLGWR